MTSVPLSFLPCRCVGKECEPEAAKEKLTVDVSEEMNVEAVRRALAAQLKPATSGFGPWKKTQVARAENVHLFMKQDGAEGELVAVTGTEPAAEKFEIAHLMSKGLNNGGEHGKEEPEGDAQGASTRWYYTVEGTYGDVAEEALCCCGLCACLAACCCCCCGDGIGNDLAGGGPQSNGMMMQDGMYNNPGMMQQEMMQQDMMMQDGMYNNPGMMQQDMMMQDGMYNNPGMMQQDMMMQDGMFNGGGIP